MKNIHVISTDKPSILFLKENTLLLNNQYTLQEVFPKGKCQNIYITSDEEIKEGYWFLDDNNQISHSYRLSNVQFANPKKIILTTDQDLIKYGVQAIDDEFLEWFVKNPSCEEVYIKRVANGVANHKLTYEYKIIIPKEEPKYPIGGYAPGNYMCNCSTCKTQFQGDKRAVQCEPCAIKMIKEEPKQELERGITITHKQETLEEAKKYAELSYYGDEVDAFVRGVKWQQEQDKKMYSEEEVKDIFRKYRINFSIHRNIQISAKEFDEWFEQFKKK